MNRNDLAAAIASVATLCGEFTLQSLFTKAELAGCAPPPATVL
jgi:hypothetical protein